MKQAGNPTVFSSPGCYPRNCLVTLANKTGSNVILCVMYASEQLIYLELQKTRCTHIRNSLNRCLGGTFDGTHNQISEELMKSDKLIIGSIRNIWDWYLSLWSYGCDRKGSLHNIVTRKRGGLADQLKRRSDLAETNATPPWRRLVSSCGTQIVAFSEIWFS